MENEYLVVHPKTPISGCLAVVVKNSKYQFLKDLEQKLERRKFLARAYLSDHIPLHGNIDDIISRPQFHRITLSENPLSIYLHHGADNAIFFDLCSDEKGQLQYIEVEIETDLPSTVFSPARTAINELIDSLQRRRSLPLIIIRIDILLKEQDEAFAHQLILPYSTALSFGPLGGIHQYSAFSTYEAVLREAIISPSPYYRLLCAYRLYEGLNKLKIWLKTTAKKIDINEKLPKDPKIDKSLLNDIGFDIKHFDSVENMNDLWKKFTPLRNKVAHFFTNDNDYPLHFSHGETYYEYSLAAAILLHYSNITFYNLVGYFNKNLNSKLSIGSILPMKEYKDRFIIKI